MTLDLVLHRLGLERQFADVAAALGHPLFGPVVRAYLRHRARPPRMKDRPMHIIGLTGFAGAGKDTVCDLLQARRCGIARAAFADALKVECAAAFGVDLALFTSPALKNTPTPALAAWRSIDPAFTRRLGQLALLPELTPRTIMQQWGDHRRDQVPDYFVRRIEPSVASARALGCRAIVITDVRYGNELAWLRAHGGALWRVTRPGSKPRSGHSSEWAIADEPADVTLPNDSTVDALAACVTDAFDDLTQGLAA